MARALKLQVGGRVDDAAREYRDVIAAAAGTHDALHMLGVIELGRGALDEAERLILAALALRPPYPAIKHNLLLIQEARTSLARAQPEELAERALPILVDLALGESTAGRTTPSSDVHARNSTPSAVHLIGRVHAGELDDGWLLRRLASFLDTKGTTRWAVDGDGSEVLDARRYRRIDAGTGSVPRGGTHVIVGLDFDCAAWIEMAVAERVVVFCLPCAPTRCLDQLRAIAHDGARPLDLVFVSEAMAGRFGHGHVVLPPPLDPAVTLAAASPQRAAREVDRIDPPSMWTVGIVGQCQSFVGEPPDKEFVKELVGNEGRLHIYDPGRFRFSLGASARTRFFERRPRGLESFLGPLGCFVHRAETWWQDTIGRELYGAMAYGVPVLCPRTSIHAERIEHGVDGLLYESAAEAHQQLSDLQRAPLKAAAIGRAGREKVLALLDAKAQFRRYREFVFGTAPSITESTEWSTSVA
jgi:hypothetical protein